MCGIAGYKNLSSQQLTIESEYLERMQKVLEHRGPDGYRIWLSQEYQIGIMHRRLSIVDLSQAGFQPMFNHNKTIMVVCNGEIYNHPRLRTQLEQLGYRYRSNSDTETIVYAYEQWGIEAINKLEGMFAIALFDMRTNELYLVRDRIGIKPLYFSLQGNILSFASEIKALWQLPWITKTINPQGLYHYLTYLVTPAPLTLYQGIYKLPAGHYLKVDAHNEVTFHEWYNPMPQEIAPAREESYYVEQLRMLLRNSVRDHMMSDVAYGVFLSGGIDSSLNVALMSEYTDRVKTFNISFADGKEYSETHWAQKVSDQFNTEHYSLEITEKEAFEFFERMVYHQDEPLADCVCIPLYYVSKLLKDSGVTVVQVGEGSDELFCGYNAYAQYINLYNRYWKHSQRFIPAFARKTASSLFATLFPDHHQHKAILHNWSHNKFPFWSGAIAFPELWKRNFLKEQHNQTPDPILEKIYPGFSSEYHSYAIPEYHLQQLRKRNPQADFLQAMIYLELKQRLPELLLMRVDKMTMATSVEARVPFLDHKIVEFAMQIPSQLKYKNGTTKYILKKACEGILPHDIIYRKKIGFAAPTMRWFKQGNYFKPYFLDLVHSKNRQWDNYINTDAVKKLYHRNQHENIEYSVQLWTLQNLLAINL